MCHVGSPERKQRSAAFGESSLRGQGGHSNYSVRGLSTRGVEVALVMWPSSLALKRWEMSLNNFFVVWALSVKSGATFGAICNSQSTN